MKSLKVCFLALSLSMATGTAVASHQTIIYNTTAAFTCASPTSATNTLWLDGTDPAGTGTPPSNGSSIATWVDKSASGFNFTQGTGAQQPTFASTGINSQGAVLFASASTQTMTNASAVFFTTGAAFDLFIVFRPVTTSGVLQTLYADKLVSNPPYLAYVNTGLYFVGSSTWTNGLYGTTVSSATNYVEEFQYNGSGATTTGNFTMTLNGSGVTRTGSGAGSGGNATAQIGGNSFQYLNAYVAAYCFYSAILSAGDRTSLMTYLNAI